MLDVCSRKICLFLFVPPITSTVVVAEAVVLRACADYARPKFSHIRDLEILKTGAMGMGATLDHDTSERVFPSPKQRLNLHPIRTGDATSRISSLRITMIV